MGRSPAEWNEMKICTNVDLSNVIMDANFKFEKKSGIFLYHWVSKFALSH